MRRTELIPQTTAPINSGQVYYHFSMMRSGINAPSTTLEHQVNFFESHFTEMKYGLISGEAGTNDANLRWDVGGQSQWTTTFDPMVWHNVAYGIDFAANTITFYHSTGSGALVKTAGPVSVSTSSNGADWHLGVLRLPGNSALNSPDVEDWFFSGVYVESGSLTTSVGSGSSGPPPISTSSKAAGPTTTTAPVKTTLTTSTKAPVTTTAVPAGPTMPKYGQCGGIGWTGGTVCAAGSTCTVSNTYYSQCL